MVEFGQVNRIRYSGLDSYQGRLYYSDDGTTWNNVNWKPSGGSTVLEQS